MEFNLQILNRFTSELIGEQQAHTVKDKALLEYFKLLDPTEQYWHIHEDSIWPIKVWKTHEIAILEKKRISDEYNAKVFKRKAALESLVKGIASKLTLDLENSRILALKFLQNRNPVELGNFFGVDLTDLPTLDKPHTVLDGKDSFQL